MHVVGFLLLLKGVLERKIYKKQLLDVLEVIVYFNILCFAAFTLYTFDTSKNQVAVAQTSVAVMFALLLSVIIYINQDLYQITVPGIRHYARIIGEKQGIITLPQSLDRPATTV